MKKKKNLKRYGLRIDWIERQTIVMKSGPAGQSGAGTELG
jgi:hypothetical protein